MKSSDITKIRKDLEKLLAAYGKEKGLEFTVGNIQYSANTIKTSIVGESIQHGRNPSKENFEANCFRFGIPHTWFGKIITLKNKKYKITGIKPRSRKYPIVLQNVRTGIEETKITVDYARSLIKG